MEGTAGPSRPVRRAHALAQPATATARTVAEQVAHHIEPLTGVTDGIRADYRSYLARDIAPHLGAVPLPLLDRPAVAASVNALAARGLSAKSIRNRHSLLSAALTTAARRVSSPVSRHPRACGCRETAMSAARWPS